MTEASPLVFEAINLQMKIGQTLTLDVPSLKVPAGEILVIIGPNGAGKSTLLQTLSALVKPSRGEIFFKGQKVGVDISLLQYRRKLAMVLQEPLLFDTTVYRNVASGLKMRGMKKREIDPIVHGNLERFGIVDLKNRSARTLSGGEARRVSLARAFATNPEALLLDEPFSSLDPMIRETLMEDLESVLRETKLTTVYVTHDRMEALRLADRLGVMRDGKMIQTGPVDTVMNRPVNAFVASLSGVENILRGQVVRSDGAICSVSVLGAEIQAKADATAGEEVDLCIRPEHLTVQALSTLDQPVPPNMFPATVERIIPIGFYRKVYLNCGFRLIVYLPGLSSTGLGFGEGDRVAVSFDPSKIHLIRQENS